MPGLAQARVVVRTGEGLHTEISTIEHELVADDWDEARAAKDCSCARPRPHFQGTNYSSTQNVVIAFPHD